MRTTTYKCDRCGAESTIEGQLSIRKVAVGVGQYYGDYSDRGNQEWCVKCRIETGLEPTRKNMPEAVPIDPLPTLEEMIREIVREEIQNQ